MPYRRLPNTDQARLRALKAACNAINRYTPDQLLFGPKTAMAVTSYTPIFEQGLNQYLGSKSMQTELGKKMNDTAKQARLYLSHYIQVFNMCIMRGEIKKEARALIGLDIESNTVPDLSTDQQLIEFGKAVVEGESRRTGNRIYNPSIANVKVKLDMFNEAYAKHKDMQATIQKHHAKFDEIRGKADGIILDIWNEVEASLGTIDTEEKRQKATEYGIVYFYRPVERQKDFLGM